MLPVSFMPHFNCLFRYLLTRSHAVSFGGYLASVLTKHAVVYASEHPQIPSQRDVRSSMIHFYRPVLSARPVVSPKITRSISRLSSSGYALAGIVSGTDHAPRVRTRKRRAGQTK